MAGLGLQPQLASVEATLARELERIRGLVNAGKVTVGEASDMVERAYRQRDAALHRLLDEGPTVP